MMNNKELHKEEVANQNEKKGMRLLAITTATAIASVIRGVQKTRNEIKEQIKQEYPEYTITDLSRSPSTMGKDFKYLKQGSMSNGALTYKWEAIDQNGTPQTGTGVASIFGSTEIDQNKLPR